MLRKPLNFFQVFIQVAISLIVQLIVNFQFRRYHRNRTQRLPPVVCQQIQHFPHGGETILNFLILLALPIRNVLSGPKECNHLILGIEQRCHVRGEPLCFSSSLVGGSIIKLYFNLLSNHLDACIFRDLPILWNTHLFKEFFIIDGGTKRNSMQAIHLFADQNLHGGQVNRPDPGFG